MKNKNLKTKDICKNMQCLTAEGENKLRNFLDFSGEKVLCADNDSTVMDGEILDIIADVVGNGAGEAVAKITEDRMNGVSDISFGESVRQRVDILVEKGLDRSHVEQCADILNFSQGFEDLVRKTIDIHGSVKNKIFILSGGFEEVIKPKIFELDLVESEKEILAEQVFANSFVFDGNNVVGVDFDSEEKNMWRDCAKLIRIGKLRDAGLISDLAKVLALGDGSNDCDMIGDDNEGLFVAYSGVVARGNTIDKSCGVECRDFFEVERIFFG